MFRDLTKYQKRWLLAALTGMLLAGAAVLFVFDPAASRLFPPCLFHKLTGLYCPGCGSLRALHSLLNGNLKAALSLNPLMLLCLPFVLYAFAAQGLHYFFNIKIPTVFLKSQYIWAIFAIIILYTIARNIPHYPFTLLTPP
jgi:hypothetical protein